MDSKNIWKNLQDHYDNDLKNKHLKDLLADKKRNAALLLKLNDILLDLSHEKINEKTLDQLQAVADQSKLWEKINQMFSGEKINQTEDRAVLHVACRAKPNAVINVDGKNVVPDVHSVLKRIKQFTNEVRSGQQKGYSGKNLLNTVVVGIGGSYLSLEFVHEAIRSEENAHKGAKGRTLKFLANVDPVDFSRCVEGLNAEETLFVINSKTFTTAETMLNAKLVRNWLAAQYKETDNDKIKKIVSSHVSACSTNLQKTGDFGIQESKVFGFWDWVGGRYSVCSAIGVLPLSLQYGYDIISQFLEGAESIDQVFSTSKNIKENIPALLGLIGFYRISIQNHQARAILPYAQSLCKFVPHVQQLDMESSGKRCSIDGKPLDYECGVINFGEPGTNGQHSFYQLMHQGRVIPCEFIGYCKSQQDQYIQNEPVTSHQELMSNFFSQPDALACGKSKEQLQAENCPEKLQEHKYFPGDRPSLSFLFKKLDAYTTGQLLALYEARTVTEGFLWNVNSFDQWGVELGKILAKDVRNCFQKNKGSVKPSFEGCKFNSATESLISKFIEENNKNQHV